MDMFLLENLAAGGLYVFLWSCLFLSSLKGGFEPVQRIIHIIPAHNHVRLFMANAKVFQQVQKSSYILRDLFNDRFRFRRIEFEKAMDFNPWNKLQHCELMELCAIEIPNVLPRAAFQNKL